MEGTSQSADGTSNSLIKINEIVNENVQKTWRLQAQVKYLKVECENLDKEIKHLKPKIDAEMDTCKSLEENLQRALKIKDSEMQAIDVATRTHPQLMQRKIDERIKLRECIGTYQSSYVEHLEKFERFKKNTEDRNPLLREMRAENAEINKLEFNKKFLNEKIKNAKRAHELKKEIYQKISNATVLKFVQAVSKYHYRESVMNQLRENEILMENQQEQYKRKAIEKKRENVLDNISDKIEIPNLNLQLPNNLMGSIYQSVLPEIRLPRSRQHYEMPETDISNILTKYKKRSEERNEMTRKINQFRLKQSNCVNFNETQRKNVRASKRSFEDAQLTKQIKKPLEPQSNIITEPKICNKTKPPGIMKRNLEKENINQHVSSSQKCVTKQVIFKIKDNSSERSSVNDKAITSDKSQEKLSQSQSNKAKHTPNTDVSSANFSFMLSSQGSQIQKNTKQITKAQTKEDLKFPTAMPSLSFIPREKNVRANKQPEEKIIKNKSAGNPEREKPISKLPDFSTVVDQIDEFSPYFKKTESSRRESQPDKSNINEDEEKAKNVVANTVTDMAEWEISDEAGQYLSSEFLTSQEDELGGTPNITFLGEDPLTDVSREGQDGFLFNLGQYSSQSSFKPFNFLN